MKQLTLTLSVILLLPLTSESSIKRHARGYTDNWCADKVRTVDGGVVIPDFDPKNPNSVKGYCYAKAVTDWQNTTMIHKTRAAVTGISPTGVRADKESGFVTGISSASVSVPYYKWDGSFDTWYQVGEVMCPRGQMTAASIFSSGRRRLGVSTICVYRDGNPIRPVKYLGLQIGWNAGYFPIEPCKVKCVATHYTIYVASPGGSITPAPTGTAHKGFSVDVDTGVYKCEGFAVSFIPDGIPGILPCASKGCVETIISLP